MEGAVSLSAIVGGGYNEFWNFKGRYRVVKGSRASKKSTTTAINLIVRLMQMPLANAIVFRRNYSTLKNSCFAQLKWAITRLGVEEYWIARQQPLELIYKPTGQKIIFRGLDDPLKTTSITVEKGYLCWAWLEEAYEIDDERDFDRVDESLRGQLPDGYYIQWTITLNPWDASHWIKNRFFDTKSPNILAMTTNYKCNEWLSEDDKMMFEFMKESDPQRYKVAGLGEWGVAEGQFFDKWRPDLHIVEPFEIPGSWIKFRSMDWGSAHPYACLWFAVDYDGNMYCYRELYGWGGKPNVGTMETAQQVGKRIAALEDKAEHVSYGILDNACWARMGVTGPTIAEELNNVLIENGLVGFGKSSKGRVEGSNALKQRLLGNETDDGFVPSIYFFKTCYHFIRTIPILTHDKHNPEVFNTDGEDHAVDAAIYACLSRPWTPILQPKKRQTDRYAKEEKPSNWAI